MGRTDEVQVILEVHAEMRRLLPRISITGIPGWERRGNGLSGDYEGGIVHHTASRSRESNPFPTKNILINGRSDLPGPLCNWGGPWCTEDAPKLVVVAAFPGNHAGASGGRSMGPLPVTTSFNKRVLGLEIDYYGAEPMTAGQMLVAEVWAKAVAKVVGSGNIERIRAHMETSITGKWDPGAGRMGVTINMADFRRRAAARTVTAGGVTPIPTPKERFMAELTEDEQQRLLKNTDQLVTIFLNPTKSDAPVGRVWKALLETRSLAARAAGLSVDVDEKALAAELAPLMRPLLEEAVQAGQSAKSSVSAVKIVDEMLGRIDRAS